MLTRRFIVPLALFLLAAPACTSAQPAPGPAPAAPVKADDGGARAALGLRGALGGPVGEVRAGVPVTGVLAAGDSLAEDQSYVDVWTYRGRKGERLEVSLASPKFDAYLRVDLPGTGDALAHDDDGGGGTDSRIVLDLLVDGTYAIVVNSLRKGETGPYTLSVASTGAGGEVPAAKDWAALYPGGGDPRERYAVVVGIETYPAGGDNLEGPRADARLMRQVLIDRYGFRPENVVTLLDREGNREQILQAVERHLGQAGPDGVAVFYYSGHGTRLDGNFAAQGATDDEVDGKDEAISVWGSGERASLILDDELGALSERLRAGRALWILDSCHSGTAMRFAAGDGVDARPKFAAWEEIRGITELPREFVTAPGAGEGALVGGPDNRAKRRVFVAASGEAESSWAADSPWPSGSNESVFTHFFLEQLRAAGPGTTFGQAVSSARGPTTAYSKRHFRKSQTPRVEGTDVDTPIAEFLGKQ